MGALFNVYPNAKMLLRTAAREGKAGGGEGAAKPLSHSQANSRTARCLLAVPIPCQLLHHRLVGSECVIC